MEILYTAFQDFFSRTYYFINENISLFLVGRENRNTLILLPFHIWHALKLAYLEEPELSLQKVHG